MSVGGGGWARWSRDGTEIYCLSPGNDLMAVAVRTTDARIDLSAARRLFGLRPPAGPARRVRLGRVA